MKKFIIIQSRHEYIVEMAIFNIYCVKRAATPKVGKLELRFLCSACCLRVLYICENFIIIQSRQEYIVEMAIFNIYCVQSAAIPKVGKLELRFTCSACCLRVLYICENFIIIQSRHEYIVDMAIFNIYYLQMAPTLNVA